MNSNSATDAIKEECSRVEETDDSCVFKYYEIVPLVTDTDGSCTTECVSEDWSAEVKQENMAVVKLEYNDVCILCHLLHSVYFSRNNVQLA